jgi:3-deoxy-D-manno-octulosonic-acid transferase
VALLPFLLLYYWRKGRAEPEYRDHWAERFGRVSVLLHGPVVWFHGASLGELKGAAPLIYALLASGHSLFITTHTPAGRRTIQNLCAEAIADRRVQVAYCPLEFGFSMRSFIRRVRPAHLIVTEIDTWPIMLLECRRAGIESALVNAQYPETSFTRDQRWWGLRGHIFGLYSRILCKTSLHRARFLAVGCNDVVVAGETRFDLPIPKSQLDAAADFVASNGIQTRQRPVICVASCGPGEESVFIEFYCGLQQQLSKATDIRPLFVHVPRSPQRFDSTYALLAAAGLKTRRRSELFDEQLSARSLISDAVDVVLGDSLGEMSFYLALSQIVIVGNSFNDLGAHNVIEPLALKKPVLVGPSIWGIEYPAREALACGALTQVFDTVSLTDKIFALLTDPTIYAQSLHALDGFYEEHAGATARHMRELNPWLR